MDRRPWSAGNSGDQLRRLVDAPRSPVGHARGFSGRRLTPRSPALIPAQVRAEIELEVVAGNQVRAPDNRGRPEQPTTELEDCVSAGTTPGSRLRFTDDTPGAAPVASWAHRYQTEMAFSDERTRLRENPLGTGPPFEVSTVV